MRASYFRLKQIYGCQSSLFRSLIEASFAKRHWKSVVSDSHMRHSIFRIRFRRFIKLKTAEKDCVIYKITGKHIERSKENVEKRGSEREREWTRASDWGCVNNINAIIEWETMKLWCSWSVRYRWKRISVYTTPPLFCTRFSRVCLFVLCILDTRQQLMGHINAAMTFALFCLSVYSLDSRAKTATSSRRHWNDNVPCALALSRSL